MSREYIDREAVYNEQKRFCGYLDNDMLNRLEIAVGRIPAADVRPVVRGKWIQTTQPMGWHDEECAECSVCGEDFVLDEWAMDEFTNLMHFCPNCGADMREES